MGQILIMVNKIVSDFYVESFHAAASAIFCDKLRTCSFTAACTFVKISAIFHLLCWKKRLGTYYLYDPFLSSLKLSSSPYLKWFLHIARKRGYIKMWQCLSVVHVYCYSDRSSHQWQSSANYSLLWSKNHKYSVGIKNISISVSILGLRYNRLRKCRL